MAGQRDRIIELINYAESLGIVVNKGKNKARGNKGFFKTNSSFYRIDIAKGLSDAETIRVLVHELAHYAHYCEDKTLKSLEFIFKDRYEDFQEELISLTVDTVPKDFAQTLFDDRDSIKKEITAVSKQIKIIYPNIKLSQKNNIVEREISKTAYKYLLKCDKVRVFSGFSCKTYSLQNLSKDFPNIKQEYVDYIKLRSLKRKLNRINSKISRLNRYYNAPSELWARSLEYYILNPEIMKQKTPKLFTYYSGNIDRIKILSDLAEIVKKY